MSPHEYYPFMAPGDKLYTIQYDMEGEQYPVWMLLFPARNAEEAQAQFAALKATGRLCLDAIEAVYPCSPPKDQKATSIS